MGKQKEYLSALTSVERISLCDKQADGTFIPKKGDDYCDAFVSFLKDHRKSINTSDEPIRPNEITAGHKLVDFLSGCKNSKDFVYVCDLKASVYTLDKDGNASQNEKIIMDFSSSAFNEESPLISKKIGLAYILTCVVSGVEYIIKFGETSLTFIERINSYNCGCVNAFNSASKTNWRFVQSIVANRDYIFKMHVKDCSQLSKKFKWGGKTSSLYASSFRKAVQEICLLNYEKIFGKGEVPIGNIQKEPGGN